MNQFRKKHVLVGDIGNTEAKIYFRNNKIEKKSVLKSNEMIYGKIKSKWRRYTKRPLSEK